MGVKHNTCYGGSSVLEIHTQAPRWFPALFVLLNELDPNSQEFVSFRIMYSPLKVSENDDVYTSEDTPYL